MTADTAKIDTPTSIHHGTDNEIVIDGPPQNAPNNSTKITVIPMYTPAAMTYDNA